MSDEPQLPATAGASECSSGGTADASSEGAVDQATVGVAAGDRRSNRDDADGDDLNEDWMTEDRVNDDGVTDVLLTDGGAEVTGESEPRRIVAMGTFDILHPGHLHYLSSAGARGDELHVIVARRDNVTHKSRPVCPDRQRVEMVDALAVVDEAHLGHSEDYYVPIERIDPAEIVLGYDQHHDDDAVRRRLRERGIDAAVSRAPAREPAYDGELLSTGAIVDQLVERRRDDE